MCANVNGDDNLAKHSRRKYLNWYILLLLLLLLLILLLLLLLLFQEYIFWPESGFEPRIS